MNVTTLATLLQSHGFNVKPIRSPTVPKGKERVRICLHAHNTLEQVEALCRIVEIHVAEMSNLSSKL